MSERHSEAQDTPALTVQVARLAAAVERLADIASSAAARIERIDAEIKSLHRLVQPPQVVWRQPPDPERTQP